MGSRFTSKPISVTKIFSVILHISDVNACIIVCYTWGRNIWALTLQQNQPASLQDLSMHIKTPNISLLNLHKEAIRGP